MLLRIHAEAGIHVKAGQSWSSAELAVLRILHMTGIRLLFPSGEILYGYALGSGVRNILFRVNWTFFVLRFISSYTYRHGFLLDPPKIRLFH